MTSFAVGDRVFGFKGLPFGALMERERLDEQEAFTHLRRAARSSGRKLSAVASEVAAGLPLPHGRIRPTRTQTGHPQAPSGE